MEKINITKQVFDKNELNNTINTSFSQLINNSDSFTNIDSNSIKKVEPTITVEEFFNNYEELFYIIPKLGEVNSHEFLIKQSGIYVGQDIINDAIQALLDEIQFLREENISLTNENISLTIKLSKYTNKDETSSDVIISSQDLANMKTTDSNGNNIAIISGAGLPSFMK